MKVLLQKSISDYNLSVRTYNEFVGIDLDECDNALYHMHQAIEKCLKSLLLFHKIPYPKTHNIFKLLTLLSDVALPEIDTIRQYVLDINAWEAVTRYAFYEIEDASLFYAVAFDYVVLYNYTRKLIEES